MAQGERTGILLLVLSAVAWSLSGIFTRAIAADAWTIIFWRAAFSFVFIAAYVIVKDGQAIFRSSGWLHAPTLAIATVSSIGTAFFIPAFKHTAIANVALIYATVPLMTAPLARLWLGERADGATLLAAAACLLGMMVIVSGSLGSPHLLGDGLALAMTASMAAMLTLYRKYPEARGTTVNLVSSLMLMAVASRLVPVWPIPAGQAMSLAGFGLVFAFAFITLAEGAKRLPAAQTALLGLLETPLAPIWAWFAFAEVPRTATILGGAVILTSVVAHIVWSARRTRPPQAAPDVMRPDAGRQPRPPHRRRA
jgi:drug/metabolite transporter (DMT)-like permease